MTSANDKDIFKSDFDIVQILYQLLRGVKDIHDANAVHRNLKPSNIERDLMNHLPCEYKFMSEISNCYQILSVIRI